MPHLLTTTAPELLAQRDLDALLLVQRAVNTTVQRDVPELTVRTQAHKEESMAQPVEVGTVAQNELPDPATFIFENPDGSRRDITGGTVEGYLRKPDGTEQSQLAMTIADGPNGEAEYSWADGDTDTASIADVGLKLTAVVTLGGMRHFSDTMVVQVVETYASDGPFATL